VSRIGIVRADAAWGAGHVAVGDRDQDRFRAMVAEPDANGCRRWLGALTAFGHGRFRVGSVILKAHRVAYALAHRTCPDDLVVRHMCHHPWCVAPEHLELGSVADNNRDAREAGRAVAPPVHRGTSHHSARVVRYQGRRATVSAHAVGAGLEPKTAYSRLARGWSVHRALSTPARSTP
jgi:hypothetical protein